jgi:purine-binding chemotaxis protein CheW
MPSSKPMTSIDWTELHARLARVRSAIEDPLVGRVQKLLILKQRSQRLARPLGEAQQNRPSLSVLDFWLAPESYAIPSEYVKAVAALREYSPLPNASAALVGVTCLRGRMLSILDLRRFFGLPSPGITDLNRILVLVYRDLEIGLLADRIDGVSTLFLDELGDPLPIASGGRATFCQAIAPGQRIVLDVPRLLASGGLVDHSRMIAAPRAAEAAS